MNNLFLNLLLKIKFFFENLYIPFILEVVLFLIFLISIIVKLIIKRKKQKIKFENHEYLKILSKYKNKLENDLSISCEKKLFIINYLIVVELNLTQLLKKYKENKNRRANDIRILFDDFFYNVSKDFEIELLGKGKSFDDIQEFLRELHEELDVMKNEILLICLSDSYSNNDLKMSVILDVVLTFIIININKLDC